VEKPSALNSAPSLSQRFATRVSPWKPSWLKELPITTFPWLPLSIMSAEQIAQVSGFNSSPKGTRVAVGLSSCNRSAATDSIPPVPQAGSRMVLTMLPFVSVSASSVSNRSTIRRTTSRGVKCSPAVSFDCSENLRISSSKIEPISVFATTSG